MDPWRREAGRVDSRGPRCSCHRNARRGGEPEGELEAGKVKLTVKAGAEGRLFGSVRAADVATAVAAAGLGELDKRRITLPSAIKSTGDHEAVVRLLDDVVATIPLQVVALKK